MLDDYQGVIYSYCTGACLGGSARDAQVNSSVDVGIVR